MIYERVNFNPDVVGKMGKEEFISMHIGCLWQDRDEATRRKMLEQAYGMIVKPAKKPKQKKEK